MKIQGAKKIHYDSGPNMTPLVDVVMVILIFLMMTASFTSAEHYLVSDVPISAKGVGGKPPPGSIMPTKFTINVDQSGPYYIAKAGNFASVKSTDPTKAYAQLKADLMGQIQSFKDAGIKSDDVQVVIYPTQAVTLDNLIPAMEAATDAGFKKISFGINQ
ncbi:MAG: biopolymer transporter ExbD [Planctomycetota bacterium]|nr:biopolymer transporter ExbD [Planctomycetota bacterium]